MIVRMANTISPNGYIAKSDGDEDWLSTANWDDFIIEAKEFNNFVMGRETYELVMRMYKDHNFNDVDCDHKIIVTSQNLSVPEGYKVVHSPQEAIAFLSEKRMDKLLLIGGGKLNSEFAKARLIDEIVLIVAPYVIGKGRPVLVPGEYEFPLELLDVQKLSEDRVKLTYKVGKNWGVL